jgi:hypothetical protein
MKIERRGLDKVEHWIKPVLLRAITIPLKDNNGKEFVLYVSIPPIDFAPDDKELQDVAKEIADKLEAKPRQLHPFLENTL